MYANHPFRCLPPSAKTSFDFVKSLYHGGLPPSNKFSLMIKQFIALSKNYPFAITKGGFRPFSTSPNFVVCLISVRLQFVFIGGSKSHEWILQKNFSALAIRSYNLACLPMPKGV